jgi:hypothetical protein
MRPIDELHQIRAGLFFWQGYDPAIKTDLGCCAIALPGGLLFVDPLPLAPEPLAELTQHFHPAGIALTNANHERTAADFAQRFGVPVFAHSEARGEVSADHWLKDGAMIFENARAIHLPGFAKGEIALHCGDAMLMGDALINVEPHSFAMLPEKYCANPKLARQSLRKLLDFSFEIMTFAHGLPIVSGARRDVENLLNP